MKQQTFWKLKMAIVLAILLSAFLVEDKTSANGNSSATGETNVGKFAKLNNSNERFDADEDEIFAMVNEQRQNNNLDVLVWDAQLAEIARDYSVQMASEKFFDHFDPQGADVVVRAKKSRLKHWNKIGENLFSVEGLRDFDAFAVTNWMKSPTHRQNILDADFNTAGIGVAQSESGEIFVTQVFIRR